MAKSSKNIHSLVADAIARLRLKLLDLTNRNRLLNFRFSSTSRKFVQLVDEVPDILFEKLTDESTQARKLYFVSLPEPPAPEEQDGFQLTPIGDGKPSSSGQLTTMHSRTKIDWKSRLDLPAWATMNGINPSFELIETSSSQRRHNDNQIQTLLLPDVMDRKLSGIREDARLSTEELGLSTLYAAFHFLEWYESESSDQALLSPLLLLPIEIDRELKEHKYRYFVSGGDASGPVANASLRERLKRDFGIDLPALEDGDTPASYAERVSRATRSHKRWQIRRFVVIGHFSFSRLVMYEDLSPDRWGSKGLENHELIKTLLAGSTGDGGDADASEFDVDNESIEKHVPVLIADADSSQFSAIVDAMKGRSFALKGPPGTGKSQTITNLIAAAMSAGKRILFVAEKQAALEVVSKRLGEAGLSPFVLELHSTKANKKRLLESFDERLHLKKRKCEADLAETLDALRTTRAQLSSYVHVMNTPVGKSGITLHDVYWHEQAARRNLTATEIGLAKTLESASSAEISRHQHAKHSTVLNQLSDLYVRCTATRLLCQHPLYGVDGLGIDSGAPETIREQFGAWLSANDTLDRVLDRADAALRCSMPRSIKELESFSSSIAALSDIAHGLNVDLVARCNSRSELEVMATTASQMRLIHDRWAEHKTNILNFDEVADRIDSLARTASDLDQALSTLGLTDSHVRDAAEALGGEHERVMRSATIVSMLEEFLQRVSSPITLTRPFLEHWSEAIGLLKATPGAALYLRSDVLADPNAKQKLMQWAFEASSINASCIQAQEQTRLTFKESPDDLTAAANVLTTTGVLFGLLKPTYRSARRCYKVLSRKAWPGASRAAVELSDWAQLLRSRADFLNNGELVVFAGDAFAGLDTPFQNLLDANAFLLAVSQQWSVLDRDQAAVGDVLRSADAALLSALESGMPENAPAVLHELSEVMRNEGQHTAGEYLAARRELINQAASDAISLGILQFSTPLSMKAAVTLLENARETLGAMADLDKSLHDNDLAFTLQPSEDDVSAIEEACRAARLIHDAHIPEDLRLIVLSKNFRVALDAIGSFSPLIESACAKVAKRAEDVSKSLAVHSDRFLGCADYKEASTESINRRLRTALDSTEEEVDEWGQFRDSIQQCEEAGLLALSSALTEGLAQADKLVPVNRLAYLRGLIRWASGRHRKLPRWTGSNIEGLRADLIRLDTDYMSFSRKAVVGRLAAASVPQGVSQGAAGDRTERALIEHESGKQRRHIPIRDLLSRAAEASRALKPCFMMSPASVAQFLPSDGAQFDIVIIDEASQMRPEEALGAIGRGKQAIIVGDPMQLPPTTFFDASNDGDMGIDAEELDIDTESVLDLGLSSLRPPRELQWHYRSRHHSLIAFSNREFYRDRLVVFPSPYPPKGTLGVQLIHVQDGIYNASQNLPEADVVVNTVRMLIESNPAASVGVVAVNQPQKDHLTERFDQLFADNDDLEAYRSKWSTTLEPFFVKNLENVQGDERDVIVISTVYGPSSIGGPVYQRFGPINSKMGHRRLNVLFTRAKERVVVITSMRPEDIHPQPGSSAGVIALKNYLQFARSGRLESGTATGASPDSPFEEEVAYELSKLGYSVEPQVGVAGFRIDMAVRHPTNKDHFIVGIECDGATYHSAKSARDRDRLREEILRRLGWKLYRIWSTDWFRSRDKEIEKLNQHLRSLVEAI